MNRRSPHRRFRQSGMSLIEVLVAFVILAFGMLGLAGLQTRTMTYSQSSLFRSQASILTDDILDRMRVDYDNAIQNRWATALTSDADSITPLTSIYQTDLKEWKQRVEKQLPNGRASIAVDASRIVTIDIRWLDNRAAADGDADGPEGKFLTKTRL